MPFTRLYHTQQPCPGRCSICYRPGLASACSAGRSIRFLLLSQDFPRSRDRKRTLLLSQDHTKNSKSQLQMVCAFLAVFVPFKQSDSTQCAVCLSVTTSHLVRACNVPGLARK